MYNVRVHTHDHPTRNPSSGNLASIARDNTRKHHAEAGPETHAFFAAGVEVGQLYCFAVADIWGGELARGRCGIDLFEEGIKRLWFSEEVVEYRVYGCRGGVGSSDAMIQSALVCQE